MNDRENNQSERTLHTVFSSTSVVDDNFTELLKRSESLQTEAFTAQREYMEELCPKLEELLLEMNSSLKALQSQHKNPFSFSSQNLKMFKQRNTTASPPPSKKTFDHTLSKAESQSENFVLFSNKAKQNTNDKSKLISKDQFSSNRTTNFSASLPIAKSKRKIMNKVKEMKQSIAQLNKALDYVKKRAVSSELRSCLKGSVCGVYDRSLGDIVWDSAENFGIFGVFNPILEKIEWRRKFNCSLGGCWNPKEEVVEWREIWRGSVCGVWNPKSSVVEWREQRLSGVCGVWNPATQKIEWQTNRKGGVVGYYDTVTETVLWDRAEKTGLCRVTRDYEEGGYITSCCNVTDWKE